MRVLAESEQQLLREIRKLLLDLCSTLDAHPGARQTLEAALLLLDELFLLVVVGEFNAGKSAVINALLGEPVLTEGATPTTARITVVKFGDEHHVDEEQDQVMVRAPAELLRQVNIVDTPGTNALAREHEALTTQYIPRADLVLFVTSVDRPFSESERAFMSRIRQWGKKIIVVVNKVDILQRGEDLEQIKEYLAEHAKQLLGRAPEVFYVSSAHAARAQAGGDPAGYESSGFAALAQFLCETLDESERVRLKLLNPLGVAHKLVSENIKTLESQEEILEGDRQDLERLTARLDAYSTDMAREFDLRLADVDNELHRLQQRGREFIESTLRLTRFPELFNKRLLQERFEHTVVADAPQQIQAKAWAIIDWLVDSDSSLWHSVVTQLERRQAEHATTMVTKQSDRLEIDRARLLRDVSEAALTGLEHYDREHEARRIAEGVQQAVAGTTLLEVSALSIGATVALLASSSAADITGMIAAGVFATLGLLVIPGKRRKAVRELKHKISLTRQALTTTLTEQFKLEAEANLAEIGGTVAPYSQFVAAESQRLSDQRQRFEAVAQRIGSLTQQVHEL